MTYNDLLQHYFERSNALQNYWTLYVVVIGGLLAFSSIRKQGDKVTTLLVSILFSFFAYKNLDAIQDVTVQRFALLDAIRKTPPISAERSEEAAERAKIVGTLKPPAFDGVRNFHITSDVLTVLALWSMERRRKRRFRLSATGSRKGIPRSFSSAVRAVKPEKVPQKSDKEKNCPPIE